MRLLVTAALLSQLLTAQACPTARAAEAQTTIGQDRPLCGAAHVAHICGSSLVDAALLESIWLEPSAAVAVLAEANH